MELDEIMRKREACMKAIVFLTTHQKDAKYDTDEANDLHTLLVKLNATITSPGPRADQSLSIDVSPQEVVTLVSLLIGMEAKQPTTA